MVRLACLLNGQWRVSWIDGSVLEIADFRNDGATLSGFVNGKRWSARLLRDEHRCTWVGSEGTFSLRRYRPIAGDSTGAGGTANMQVIAPMPGQILAVHVQQGDQVQRGARLVTLEAMKMEHTLTAASAATIGTVDCQPGQRVQDGALLLRLDPA